MSRTTGLKCYGCATNQVSGCWVDLDPAVMSNPLYTQTCESQMDSCIVERLTCLYFNQLWCHSGIFFKVIYNSDSTNAQNTFVLRSCVESSNCATQTRTVSMNTTVSISRCCSSDLCNKDININNNDDPIPIFISSNAGFNRRSIHLILSSIIYFMLFRFWILIIYRYQFNS